MWITRERLGRMARLLAAALAVGGLGRIGPVGAQAPEVVITATEYAFAAPDQIGAGSTSFVLVNNGQEQHHAQIARLQDGKTLDDLTAALRSGNEGAIFALLEFVGGPASITPGARSARVTVDLRAGLHVLMCFITSPDGTPHFAKGMLKPMQVTAATGQPAAPPTTNGTITLKDFAFVLPSGNQTGPQTWNVVNQGPQPHEMTLFRLNPGKSVTDLLSGSGPPPAVTLGGVQALQAGKNNWLTVDLQPATYALVCFVPDPATGKAHAELGMVAEFQVGGGGALPLPDTGEAPVPVALPDTGNASGLPVLGLIAALLLLALGAVARRRSA